MEWSYWKIVCIYGHVGLRKEVSVARHLRLPTESSLLDVIDVAKTMPGVKNNGIFSGRKITLNEYLSGHRGEVDNFYLKNLKSFKRRSA